MKTKIFLAGFCLALTACESMDLVPKSEGNTDSWYTSETELTLAANEFYILGYWQEPLSSSEQWSDNTTYRLVNRNPGSNGTVLDGTLNGQQYEVYALWQQSYKLIARANTMLENIQKAQGKVTDAVYKRFAGEAYFARACKYADLIFFYGDVPYMDHTETITEAEQQGRMPKADLIPLVYADFDKAIEGLPVTYGASEPIHATKGAALAMKARFALYMGDYTVAAEAAKACMDLGIYSLEPDYAKLFKQSTKLNDEKVFVLPRSIVNEILLDSWIVKNSLPRNVGGYGSYNPSWDLFASYLCTDGLPIDESPLFDPRNPFKNRDPRCAMTIVEFNTEHCGFEYDPSPVAKTVMNYTTGKTQANQDTRIVNQYSSYTGLLWKKGIDASWMENGFKVEQDYTIMRYADVLLMYAEAMIERDKIDDTVLNAINQVRARAYGVTASQTDSYPAVQTGTQAELRKIVRMERRMEFAMENQRLQDLMRWKLASKALNGSNYIMLLDPTQLLNNIVNKDLWFWGMTPQIDEDGLPNFSALFNAGLCATGAKRIFPNREYLWPIPTHDMELCPNLTNNLGY
ncbi:RagB/SusD family nutrient uptake outer membrane protein [uncultured Bacteroides sp.]|uniref:RagB/SusD family nutrient uptake outer membrane protein n=1 Tax=uncultured Bacteroides sp. TaxID=162156 RepID=UPI002AAAA18F|nr:RagB/SusD family nutrient uptake outer membrane protein [uncultured Bacteroides sp.]